LGNTDIYNNNFERSYANATLASKSPSYGLSDMKPLPNSDLATVLKPQTSVKVNIVIKMGNGNMEVCQVDYGTLDVVVLKVDNIYKAALKT
jgi:hypothetical protein